MMGGRKAARGEAATLEIDSRSAGPRVEKRAYRHQPHSDVLQSARLCAPHFDIYTQDIALSAMRR